MRQALFVRGQSYDCDMYSHQLDFFRRIPAGTFMQIRAQAEVAS
jgi:hypothetical protein